MRTCDSCNDMVERRNLRLTPTWVIAVCRKCFDQEMQWRYMIDKEWPAETWEGLSANDDQEIPPGRISQTSSGPSNNVSPQE
jgi:hypothetical protein